MNTVALVLVAWVVLSVPTALLAGWVLGKASARYEQVEVPTSAAFPLGGRGHLDRLVTAPPFADAERGMTNRSLN